MPTPLRQNQPATHDRDYFPNWAAGVELELTEARRVRRTATGVTEPVRVSDTVQGQVLEYLAKKADWDRSGYGARPSARTIATAIRRHIRTVRDALKVLRLKGLIDIARQGGGQLANAYVLITRASRRRDRRASTRGAPPLGWSHTTPPPPDHFGVGREGHLSSSGAEKHRQEDTLRVTRPGAAYGVQGAESAARAAAEAMRAAARERLASKSAQMRKGTRPNPALGRSAAALFEGLRRP